MSTAKYFNGTEQLTGIQPVRNEQFAAMGGVKSVHNRYDGFSRLAGRNAAGVLVPVTRLVFFKSNPSLHKCDARCQHAKGHNCECSCGGEFHGALA
jgi:hypothetical protein